MTIGMSMDQFLRHSGRAGGRGKYLSGWKDSPDRAITVWLSMRVGILPLWRHQWVRVVPREKDGIKTREVWQERLRCLEHEEVLTRQHFRDKVTGERDLPPQVCPHCMLQEYVRAEVMAGRMKFTQPLFKFEGTDPTKTRFLYAGGIYGGFGAKSLTAEDKAAMAAIPQNVGGPVFSRDAFKHTSMAKLEYAMCVVNHAKPDDGVQMMVESSGLGQEFQKMVAHAIKSLDDGTGRGTGERLGNPLITPYAIRFEFTPPSESQPFGAYASIRMEKIRITPAVEKLIRSDPPATFGELAEPFNVRTHRALLERHALAKLPWDQFFEAAFEAEAKGKLAKPEEQPSAAQDPEPRTPEVGTAPAAAQDEEFGCDTPDCDGVMKALDTRCPKCNRSYEVNAAPQPPPKPALPKRSTAQTAPASSPAREPEPSGDQGDDIPF